MQKTFLALVFFACLGACQAPEATQAGQAAAPPTLPEALDFSRLTGEKKSFATARTTGAPRCRYRPEKNKGGK